MSFSTRDSDPAKLLLSLEWHRVNAEIHRIYDNVSAHNPRVHSRFIVNLNFMIPLIYPDGIHYEADAETNRNVRLQWMEMMRRKCHHAMQTRL